MTIYRAEDGKSFDGNINGSEIHTLTLDSLKKEINIGLDEYVKNA